MLINLPNGRTISISLERYLDMTDAEYNELIALSTGTYINNPFHALDEGVAFVEDSEEVVETDSDVLRQLNIKLGKDKDEEDESLDID